MKPAQLTLLFVGLMGLPGFANEVRLTDEIHVLVWNERQPQQQQAYPQFLGEAISKHLRQQAGLKVRARS